MRAIADALKHAREAGFTIVELLVTVLIVSILASAVLPMAELARQRGKEHELRQALLQIRAALDAYKQASDEGLIARKPGESGYPHLLEDLVSGVADAKDPVGAKRYFLRRLPRDPTFPDAAAAPAQTWGKRSYASSAEAPREGVDVYDVYSLTEGAGLNGIPFRDW
jgi:general secretion pathway protein G